MKKIIAMLGLSTLIALGLVAGISAPAGAHTDSITVTCDALSVDLTQYAASQSATYKTEYQRYSWTGKHSGIDPATSSPTLHPEHWQANTSNYKGGDPIGEPFHEGEGHSASWFYWTATQVLDKPEKVNTVKIVIDGTTVVDTTFGTSYEKTFTFADRTVAHTWSVVVTAWDDSTWNVNRSGTSKPCLPPFDWDWQYAAPTCDALTVVYPANIPDGQANDVNVKIKNLDTNAEVTLNFHNNDGTWSGTKVFTFAEHANWPGWAHYSPVWVQVAGTNYHWTGLLDCGEAPPTCPAYDFEAEKMWEVTWGWDFENRNGKAPKFTMNSHGGLTGINGGPVPQYMLNYGDGDDWRWLYVTTDRVVTYQFADGTEWKVTVTGTDCTPSIVWEMTPPPVVVPLPPMPVWTDTCGVNNGYWTYPADGNGYTWKIVDHSTLSGKVGVIVTLTDPNEVFPHGKNYKQWTAVQDNTECPPVVPEKPEPVVKTTTDEALDCEAKTVTTVTTTVTTDWVYDESTNTWVEGEPVTTTETDTRDMTDSELSTCPVPPTDDELAHTGGEIGWGLAALAMLMLGAGVVLRLRTL